MAEYIKRDFVMKKIMATKWMDGHDGAMAMAIAASAPAADVAPAVHGRWIYKGEYAVCTECGGRSGTQYDGVEPIPLMTQFCPNCGEKMDGVEEQEK